MRRTAPTTKEPSNTIPRPPGTGVTSSDAAWTDISVKPYQLMKLRIDVNDLFKADTIVSLSDDIEAPYNTPTKYPGQDQVNKDVDTKVRVFKWTKIETTALVQTGPGKRIQHAHLVDPVTNRRGQKKWASGTAVKVQVPSTADDPDYKTVIYPVRPHPDSQMFPIANGLVGEVVKCYTMSGAEVGDNSTRSSSWTYVVQFSVAEKQYGWLKCAQRVTVTDLVQLTQSEVAEERKNILQTTGGREYALVSYWPTGR